MTNWITTKWARFWPKSWPIILLLIASLIAARQYTSLELGIITGFLLAVISKGIRQNSQGNRTNQP
ncbi:MAG: hypothetical protein HC835_14070 [Oscillatoriales cyanobacterium RM2_1_1]|nr:hypothetical protein [Oscillatoriales cyanobacterium SM2_3_0]NJO46656.1 hypothetical protein [Oscillatoriales cyanobacterium RM2_1_1]